MMTFLVAGWLLLCAASFPRVGLGSSAEMSAGRSLLEALGFAPQDRVVVVHVDDLGMCAAANRGAMRALEGAATAGGIMVPCPAFGAMAELATTHADLDLGVHLTLNAEYETYRWKPVRDDVPSLVAADGAMWPTSLETAEQASVEDVERELRAQIDRALAVGIDVTHLDSHMGTVFHPKFFEVYLRLAREKRLPVFVPRASQQALAQRGLQRSMAYFTELLVQAEADGFPIFDHFDSDSLGFEPGTGIAHTRRRLERLGPGLSYLITHCAEANEELRRITPDWRQRDEECRIYSDGTVARLLDQAGVHTIGMRLLRDLFRSRVG